MRGILSALFALIFFCLVCAGCAGFGVKTSSVCSNIPEGTTSVICSTATALNVSPEAVSSIITVSNMAGLVSGAYTAEEAIVVIDTMDAFVVSVQKNGGITYISLIQMALSYYNTLSPKMQAAFIVLQEFITVPDALGGELLTDYDYTLILAALAKQRLAVTPFLAS